MIYIKKNKIVVTNQHHKAQKKASLTSHCTQITRRTITKTQHKQKNNVTIPTQLCHNRQKTDHNDGKTNTQGNCLWQTQSPALQAYHDHEWGRPVNCDHILFEKISLETLQAGLSWRTVLDKRDAIRACFKQFNINKVMVMTPQNTDHSKKPQSHTQPQKKPSHRTQCGHCIRNTTNTWKFCKIRLSVQTGTHRTNLCCSTSRTPIMSSFESSSLAIH